MGEAPDLASYVRQAAAAVGLTIAEEDFDAVVSSFAVLARVAAPVMAFPLPEDLTAAAIFAPNERGER